MILRLLAKTISYLFHPLLMPTFGLWLLLNTNSHMSFFIAPAIQTALLAVVFVSTFVFPVLSTFILLFARKIKSLEMEASQERKLPYLLTAAYYTFGYYIITSKLPLPIEISVMMLGVNLSVVLTLIVNITRKISAHAVGMGGLIGAFIGIGLQMNIDSTAILSVLFLMAGLTGFARLHLNAHTPAEVYMGYALGFCSVFILFLFLPHGT